MKLAVVGSRSFQDYAWLEHCLLRVFRVEELEAVISGGARGADSLAARFAASHGVPLIVVPADGKAGQMEDVPVLPLPAWDNFQSVFPGNGVEHGFQIVVAVGAFLHNVQPQVDFGIRESDHSFFF